MSVVTRLFALIAFTLLLVAGVELVNGVMLRQKRLADVAEETTQLARVAELDMVRIVEGSRQLLATLAKLPARGAWDKRACGIVGATASSDFEYDHLVATDRDGIVVCSSSGPGRVGLPSGDIALVERIVRTAGFSVGSYGIGAVSGNEVIRVGYPVVDEAGAVVGAIYAGINVTWLNTAINQWKLGDDLSIQITDRNGILIAGHPDPRGVGRPISGDLKPFLAAARAGAVKVTEAGGVVRLYGYTPAEDTDLSDGVGVFVGRDQALIFADIDRSIWLNAAAVLAALLASAVVAVAYVRRFLARPFENLLGAAARWREGDWSKRIGTASGIPEFDRLALAFDGMAAEVAARTAELSARNREITLFSRMTDFLQASDTEAEAYAVISNAAAQLFPDDSGALFVMNASRNMVEANAAWGKAPPANVVFPPNDCWALRHGQVHVFAGNEVRCRHVAQDGRLYACLPLIANGETLGILHLADGAPSADGAAEARLQDNVRLAKTFAEHIGLAIANLRLRDAMRSLSIRDPLTGLFNRRYMEEALAQELFRAKRQPAPLAVIMLDIDHFKRFNDSFGHDGGDAVLRGLGAFLKKSVRGGDVVCRYGGEEFLLLLSPATPEGARQRAEQLREGVQALNVRQAGASLGTITVSLGLALFPEHGAEPEALVKAADIALYEAKQAGRDRVVVYARSADQAPA